MIPLIYGSTTGNTERVAQLMVECWPGEVPLKLISIDSMINADVEQASSLIIGVPTWNFGELQEDFEEVWSSFCEIDFSGKRVALFGLGDQLGYGDWFLDAMGTVAAQISQKGAKLIGEWPVEGYDFESSKALIPCETAFVGLALDEDTQSFETRDRVERWFNLIYPQL
ncbi:MULTISPECIES: flavodoxin [unclassified Marinobacterium]|uniref:flavodoxin n=1 Tax=unclassified Marinobacterium TaxID=2644139 RepID=UPI001568406D|nr:MULTISPECIES: flavodoxin [unclassified Marinobacterium]NRP35260.1 Flavodoxin [Marinobacterium sp. xm-d-579]NRP53714.1 Flavodoxin [Marinobacterium sp. xm-v-242]NRP78212.1 Flavodoxin [Marinobacterium sp. xm-m-383]NRQ02938.1 Flavodoxin [Marinobacterium sp. xm-d-530]